VRGTYDRHKHRANHRPHRRGPKGPWREIRATGSSDAASTAGSHAEACEWRSAAPLAADLARQQVAVIITLGGDASALAAKAGTATTPIVFATGSDPVRTGLVSNLHRPGGNITGVSTFLAETEPKRLELLRELRPHATAMAVLVNPGAIPRAEFQLSDIQAAARSVGQDINILNASTIRDIDAAFAKLVQMRADALLVATDAFFFTRAPQLVVLTARHAIPTMYFRREFAAAGGLMSYAANANESYRLLGVYAARILKGEKPGDVDEVRAGDQRQHREGARPRSSADAARPRRRGD
jgi:putative tryptophan/tyrosine transport system substrate-binding protein